MKCLFRLGPVLLAAMAGFGLQAAPLSVTSGIFILDRTAPEIPTLISPLPGASVDALPVRLEVIALDATSGVVAYCFEYSSRTSGWVPPSSTEPTTAFLVSSLSAGTWSWRCKARDRAGNESAWSGWSTFVLTVNDAKTDSDADELPDTWELSTFGRLNYSNGIQDSDGDGVSDAEECAAGTNPLSFSVSVTPGWNLLALPVKMNAESAAVFHAATGGGFWVYDGARYQISEAPEGYQGFWVYALRAASNIPITGTVPLSGSVTLGYGWTLAGPGFNAHLPPLETSPVLGFWYWHEKYFETGQDQFSAFTGYWIFSLGGTLDFEQLRAP